LDIKTPNILLSSTNPNAQVCAKIADFGTCVITDGPIMKRYVDNPVWLAPEILQSKPYNYSVDIYAFGVIAWEMLSRESFLGNIKFWSDIEQIVISGKRPTIPRAPKLYKNMIENCWHQDASVRPNCDLLVSRIMKLQTNVEKIENKYPSIILPKPSPREDKTPMEKYIVEESIGSSNPESPRISQSIPVESPRVPVPARRSLLYDSIESKGRSKTSPASNLPPPAIVIAKNTIAKGKEVRVINSGSNDAVLLSTPRLRLSKAETPENSEETKNKPRRNENKTVRNNKTVDREKPKRTLKADSQASPTPPVTPRQSSYTSYNQGDT